MKWILIALALLAEPISFIICVWCIISIYHQIKADKKQNVVKCKECKFHCNKTGQCKCSWTRVNGVYRYTANDDYCKYGTKED